MIIKMVYETDGCVLVDLLVVQNRLLC